MVLGLGWFVDFGLFAFLVPGVVLWLDSGWVFACVSCGFWCFVVFGEACFVGL